jgi:hypothetical protein
MSGGGTVETTQLRRFCVVCWRVEGAAVGWRCRVGFVGPKKFDRLAAAIVAVRRSPGNLSEIVARRVGSIAGIRTFLCCCESVDG